MTLLDFKTLSEQEQVHIMRKRGVYIGKRRIPGFVVLMYQVESFYVEVFYKKYRHSIAGVNCTEYTGILDPYLEQIELAPLA